MDLQFIIKHPVSVCPGCGIILDFTVNDEIKGKFNEAMSEIEDIKKKYKNIAKFG
jgi:transcription initiation factor IIE alpha subunit